MAGEWYKYKKEKNGKTDLEKKTLQRTFFTSVLIIAREIPKKIKREKSWQDVSVNLYENIPQAQKLSVYLLGISNYISKFIFKTSQCPFVASLC